MARFSHCYSLFNLFWNLKKVTCHRTPPHIHNINVHQSQTSDSAVVQLNFLKTIPWVTKILHSKEFKERYLKLPSLCIYHFPSIHHLIATSITLTSNRFRKVSFSSSIKKKKKFSPLPICSMSTLFGRWLVGESNKGLEFIVNFHLLRNIFISDCKGEHCGCSINFSVTSWRVSSGCINILGPFIIPFEKRAAERADNCCNKIATVRRWV